MDNTRATAQWRSRRWGFGRGYGDGAGGSSCGYGSGYGSGSGYGRRLYGDDLYDGYGGGLGPGSGYELDNGYGYGDGDGFSEGKGQRHWIFRQPNQERIKAMATTTPATEVVIVRSPQAGVFYGRLVSRNFDEVTLENARRCWYWDGAATLSELSSKGPSKPQNCKFPAPTVGEHVILGVCEIIPVTPEALAALDAVPVWTAHS